jgi:hypothetical protein
MASRDSIQRLLSTLQNYGFDGLIAPKDSIHPERRKAAETLNREYPHFHMILSGIGRAGEAKVIPGYEASRLPSWQTLWEGRSGLSDGFLCGLCESLACFAVKKPLTARSPTQTAKWPRIQE